MDPQQVNLNKQFIDPIGAAKANGPMASAASDGIAGNPFIPYFGQSNGPVQFNARDAYRSDRRDLPHAYIGQNNFLREILDGSIFGNRESWYTSFALPFIRNDNLTISWSNWTFDSHLVSQVPHEGIPRMITSSEKGQSEKVTRRGLSFTLEHDFWRTERGQRNYLYNIMQIRDSVQLTCNYDCLVAILTADYYTQEIENKVRSNHLNMSNYLNDEITMFGIAQKDPRGLEVSVEMMQERLRKLGVQPNLFIVPPRMRIYLSMISDFHTSHDIRGEKGVSTFEQGPSTSGILRGMNTVTTDEFSVYQQSNIPVDLMARERDTGAYFCMFQDDTHVIDSNYKSDHRSVIVYDEDVDGMVKITIKQAIDHCARFNKEGNLDEKPHNCVVNKEGKSHRDIFVYNDTTNTTRLCTYWGDLEPEYLSNSTLKKMVKSITFSTGSSEAEQQKYVEGIFSDHDKKSQKFIKEILPGLNYSVSSVTPKTPETPETPGTGTSLHESNKKLLVSSNFATVPYENALMFATDRNEFVKKFNSWITTNRDNLPNFSSAYVKLKKFNTNTKRDKIKDFTKVLSEMQILRNDESLNISTDPVSDSLVFEPAATTSPETYHATTSDDRSLADRIEDIMFKRSTNVEHSSQELTSVGSGSRWEPKRSRDIGSHISQLMGSANIGSLAQRSFSAYTNPENGMTKNLRNRLTNKILQLSDIEWISLVLFLTSRITRDSIMRLIESDIFLPLNFMCIRPFVRHRMYSMVLMKGGYDTGATFIGHTNMLLSDDGATKMHYGNYTFNHKSIVMNPKNIIVASDVMFGGYRGGNGTRFFNDDDIGNILSNKKNVLRNASRSSIMSIMLPAEENQFNHHPIDVSGWYQNDNKQDLKDQHYSTSQYYNARFGFKNGTQSRLKNTFIQKFLKSQRGYNTILCQDQYNYWSNNGFNGFRRSRSHLGPDLYAGVRGVFDGHLTAIEKQHYKETM